MQYCTPLMTICSILLNSQNPQIWFPQIQYNSRNFLGPLVSNSRSQATMKSIYSYSYNDYVSSNLSNESWMSGSQINKDKLKNFQNKNAVWDPIILTTIQQKHYITFIGTGERQFVMKPSTFWIYMKIMNVKNEKNLIILKCYQTISSVGGIC